MNPDHLAELAEQLLQARTGSLRQAMINRAISTAYYALFHALAAECVARTVGSPRSTRYWEIVTPIHRSVEHGPAKRIFERAIRDRSSSADLKRLAETFIALQSARHAADYDPGYKFSRREALDLVVQGRLAIEALRAMPKEDRLILVVQIITKPR